MACGALMIFILICVLSFTRSCSLVQYAVSWINSVFVLLWTACAQPYVFDLRVRWWLVGLYMRPLVGFKYPFLRMNHGGRYLMQRSLQLMRFAESWLICTTFQRHSISQCVRMEILSHLLTSHKIHKLSQFQRWFWFSPCYFPSA